VSQNPNIEDQHPENRKDPEEDMQKLDDISKTQNNSKIKIQPIMSQEPCFMNAITEQETVPIPPRIETPSVPVVSKEIQEVKSNVIPINFTPTSLPITAKNPPLIQPVVPQVNQTIPAKKEETKKTDSDIDLSGSSSEESDSDKDSESGEEENREITTNIKPETKTDDIQKLFERRMLRQNSGKREVSTPDKSESNPVPFISPSYSSSCN